MELLAKRRQDRLHLAVKKNHFIKTKMNSMWSGIEEDPEAILQDESDLNLEPTRLIQQFEKNVFRIFPHNITNAQTLIGNIPDTQYAKFNAIFPRLLAMFYGASTVDVRSVYNAAMVLIQKHQNIQAAPNGAPPAPPATATATASATVESQIQCPVPGCPGFYLRRNKATHEKTGIHRTAVQKQQIHNLTPSKKASRRGNYPGSAGHGGLKPVNLNWT